MNMEHTECSETSAYKIQTPGNYPKERIQYSEHGESLKSRIIIHVVFDIHNALVLKFSAGLRIQTRSRFRLALTSHLAGCVYGGDYYI